MLNFDVVVAIVCPGDLSSDRTLQSPSIAYLPFAYAISCSVREIEVVPTAGYFIFHLILDGQQLFT